MVGNVAMDTTPDSAVLSNKSTSTHLSPPTTPERAISPENEQIAQHAPPGSQRTPLRKRTRSAKGVTSAAKSNTLNSLQIHFDGDSEAENSASEDEEEPLAKTAAKAAKQEVVEAPAKNESTYSFLSHTKNAYFLRLAHSLHQKSLVREKFSTRISLLIRKCIFEIENVSLKQMKKSTVRVLSMKAYLV